MPPSTPPRALGTAPTAQLRAHRDFGNPYHLEEVISTYGIDDKGTGYPQHLWDPLALPVAGHADVLDARQAQQEEARRQRQAQRTSIAFSSRHMEMGDLGPGGLSGGGGGGSGGGSGPLRAALVSAPLAAAAGASMD